jgi:hypothetical protein
MAKSKTSFDSNNQPVDRPPRGQSFKTKLIESLKRKNMTEDDFIDMLVERAIADGGVFLQELLKRYNPVPKQSHESIIVEGWPKDGTPAEKANKVLDCITDGTIPPDVGSILIEAISKSLGIEEVTELAKRLEAIEKLLADKNA